MTATTLEQAPVAWMCKQRGQLTRFVEGSPNPEFDQDRPGFVALYAAAPAPSAGPGDSDGA